MPDITALKRPWLQNIIGLLLLAACPVLFFTKGAGAPDHSRPVSLVLPRDGMWVTSDSFRAKPPGKYRASVKLEREYQFREMECLADVGRPDDKAGRRTDCLPAFSPAELEWMVIEEGRPATMTYDFGGQGGEYSETTIGRSLGIYDLRGGRSYVVRARVANAPDEFWATEPRLELAYDDMAALAVLMMYFSASSAAMAVVGVGLLIVAIWSAVRQPRPA